MRHVQPSELHRMCTLKASWGFTMTGKRTDLTRGGNAARVRGSKKKPTDPAATSRKGRSRAEWWPDPDPMPAILKALGSPKLRQEFKERLDDCLEDLMPWLDGEDGGLTPPETARQLILAHFEKTDGDCFDEVEVGTSSTDIGLGYNVTLYARRRGALIHYRSRDDDGGSREFPPSRAPLSDAKIDDLIGPDETYDYESEAE